MDSGYEQGLAALSFFCFDSDEQVASTQLIADDASRFFFPDHGEEHHGCEYYYGVACVFITYASSLHDKFLSSDESPNLIDFHQHLNFLLQDCAAEWSSVAVMGSDNWRRLRDEATKAMEELDEELPAQVPTFNVNKLISPAEFRTSDEARQLLE